jgi:hypothetical protein
VRNKQRRAEPNEEIEWRGGCVFGSQTADHRGEHRDVILRLDRQRPNCRQALVVASRAPVLRCEEAGRAMAIAHLAKVGCAGEAPRGR